MEEELNYVTVAFRTDGTFTREKPKELETIYDEVKFDEQAWDTNPVPENEKEEEIMKVKKKKKAPTCTLLHLVAAGLGMTCVILTSAVIALWIHFNTVMSEQYRENINLTAQNLQLWTEKTDLERQTEQLTRERDRLNWTMGVILEYENFPVKVHCPQKVCKPCLDGWMLFQSSCYLFSSSDYHYQYSWQGSRDECRKIKADLVVIESQEEQEFIYSHMKNFKVKDGDYWIGLSYKDDAWMWVDGSNFTVMYWESPHTSFQAFCALTLPRTDTLANWHKKKCSTKNNWICETRALVKLEEKSAALLAA